MSFLDNKEDEHDKFAGNVAVKLRKMDSMQTIFAENLINQVLFNGLLGRLNEHWTIQRTSALDSNSAAFVGSCSEPSSNNYGGNPTNETEPLYWQFS